MGNVVAKTTTLPGGTVNEAYCYDEQDRMVWAGSKGTPSCGVGLTQGTLAGGLYTESYAFDNLNRLTTGPRGTGYTYGDANHLDAVTSAPSYTASYDAAGEMATRNGQALTYDALDRMITWQNAATAPTQAASYAYDGEGNRVQMISTITSSLPPPISPYQIPIRTTTTTTTTTNYFGTYEEISVSGANTVTRQHYNAGPVTAVNVNGAISYLVQDGLSSVAMALSSTGTVTMANLYAPYGMTIYTTGTSPTDHGFTGMIQDLSGMLYDNARYYDNLVGQFTSGDFVQGPNRYAYVGGNPETYTDPSGKYFGK